MNYLEDHFDLDVFRRETINNRAALYRKKNAGLVKLITFIIALASFALAFVLYDFLSFSIEQLRFLV